MQSKNIFASILFFFISLIAMAQNGGTPPTPSGPEPPGAPIDSSILILLVVGLVYGIYKARKISKRVA